MVATVTKVECKCTEKSFNQSPKCREISSWLHYDNWPKQNATCHAGT